MGNGFNIPKENQYGNRRNKKHSPAIAKALEDFASGLKKIQSL